MSLSSGISAPLPWQKLQWQYLMQCIQANKLSHALLLSGVKGLGKQAFAMAFANYLICADLHKQQLKSPCKQCSPCQLFTAQHHPDVFIIGPEAEGKLIRVDAIRQLIQKLSQTCFAHQYRVAVIQQADLMHVSAANALLKTLEEPGTNTVLILTSDQAAQIPLTVRSRCQTLLFTPHYQAETTAWLQTQLSAEDKASELLNLAEGAPLTAIKLAHDKEHNAQRKQLIQNLFALSKSEKDPVQISMEAIKLNTRQVLLWLIHIVNDLLRLHMYPEAKHIINYDCLIILKSLIKSSKFNVPSLFYQLDKLYNLHSELYNSNLNLQLAFEEIFCYWYGQLSAQNPI